MKKRWPIVSLVFVLALVAGCDIGGGKTGAPSATPVGPDTGLREVGAVVRFIPDVAALVAMTNFTTVECATDLGGGGPPLCSSLGVPPGTKVETLPVTISESEYQPKDLVPALYRQWFGYVLRFAGVLKPTRHPALSTSLPVPDLAVVFKPAGVPPPQPPGRAFAFYLLGGRIIAVQWFDGGAATLPPPDDPAWLMPPAP